MSKKKVKNLRNICIEILITLVIIELSFRIFYENITPKEGRILVGIMIGELDSTKVQNVQSHPYMLYVNTPMWENGGFVQINSLGYRGHEITKQPQLGVYRILTLGGSTTLDLPYINNPNDTWSANLEKILTQELNRNVEVVNGGLTYATSAELLSHYMFRDRYLGAKMVVLHIGYNDVIPLLFDNYTPEYTNYRSGWDSSVLQPRPGEKSLLQIYIFKVFYAWWLNSFSFQQALGQKQDWYDINPNVAMKNLKQNDPIGFRRNVELLVRTIQADGAIPVIFPEELSTKEIFDKNPSLQIYRNYYDVLEAGLQKNRQVLDEIAQKYNVTLINIPEGTISVDYFLDHLHLNESGEKITARIVANNIEPIIQQQIK
jgi:lysophospholipase L1-like esterase